MFVACLPILSEWVIQRAPSTHANVCSVLNAGEICRRTSTGIEVRDSSALPVETVVAKHFEHGQGRQSEVSGKGGA